MGALPAALRDDASRGRHPACPPTPFGWQLTEAQRLTGRIEWDPDSDTRMPMVISDGKPFMWEQVGHMLMTFEGFTLETRIRDTIDVVGDSSESSL